MLLRRLEHGCILTIRSQKKDIIISCFQSYPIYLCRDDMSEMAFVDGLKSLYEHVSPEKKGETKKMMKASLDKSFRDNLDAMVERWLEPPSMGVIDVTNTNFVPMFIESSMCYVYGLFYSTISLCGITAERLSMDILARHSFMLDGKTLTLSDLNFLFAIPHSHMINLLHGWGIINEKTKNSLYVINTIRNKYVHPDVIPNLELPDGKTELKKDALVILTNLKSVLSQSFPRNIITPVTLELKKLEEISK